MAWAVKTSVNTVPGRTGHEGACLAVGEPCSEVRRHVRLIVEMDAAFVATVDITTDRPAREVRVEVRQWDEGRHGWDGEWGS